MFESVIDDGPATRFRTATLWPGIAFLIGQGYFTVAPLIGRFLVWLFWGIAVLCVAGTATGIVLGVAALLRPRPPLTSRDLTSLVVLIAAIALCGWTATSMVRPWIR